MKRLSLLAVLAILPLLFSFSVKNTTVKLADEIAGVYTGVLTKNGQTDKSFSLQVSKVSDKMVEVIANEGNSCQSFKAKVSEDHLSNIRILRLEPIGNVVMKNGMMTPSNGRLSYGVSPKGSKRMEVFTGMKE